MLICNFYLIHSHADRPGPRLPAVAKGESRRENGALCALVVPGQGRDPGVGVGVPHLVILSGLGHCVLFRLPSKKPVLRSEVGPADCVL